MCMQAKNQTKQASERETKNLYMPKRHQNCLFLTLSLICVYFFLFAVATEIYFAHYLHVCVCLTPPPPFYVHDLC